MADWDGSGYEQISELQRTVAGRTLAGLQMTGDERVLDVGCGDGYLTKHVAARLPDGSIVGIDASPRMIATACGRPAPPRARLAFLVASADALPFKPAFDLVMSFNALHWVVDSGAALRAIAGAVRVDGRVLLQFVCGGPRPSVEEVAMHVCGASRWSRWFAGFEAPYVHADPDAYLGLAAEHGLDVISSEVHDDHWRFTDATDFRAWCTVGFAEWTARLPADDRADWVADVADRYAAVSGDPALFRFYQLVLELRRRGCAGRKCRWPGDGKRRTLKGAAGIEELSMSGQMIITIHEERADDERLEALTSALRRELMALDVDDVDRVSHGAAPPGTRAVELAAVGALLVVFKESAQLVTGIVTAIRSWLQAAPPGRSVEITLGDTTLKVASATPAQQDQLIAEFVGALQRLGPPADPAAGPETDPVPTDPVSADPPVS